MYIYKIENRLTGKSYIGQTIQNPVARWKQHCRAGEYAIGRALKKYGKENFTFQVIFTASDRENLDKMEKIFIKMYDTMSPNGYNLCEGGNAPKLTEETKRKLSEALKGKKKSEEHKQKMSEAHKGKTNRLGHTHTKGSKRKISEANSKPIICLETGEKFASLTECAEKMGLHTSNISAVLKSKQKTTKGYTFKYFSQGEPK